MSKKKRDSAYYLARLSKEHPGVFADLSAGRYPSVRAAAIAAGLRREPSGLLLLKRNWTKASPSDRRGFLAWLKTGAPRKKRPIVDAAGCLTPDAVDFLRGWLVRNRVKPGRIMRLIGFKNFDYRLAEALNKHRPLRAEVVLRLERWLGKQGFR